MADEGRLPRVGTFWEDVCSYIIRPPRAEYTADELGPDVFRLSTEDKRQFRREDVEIENMRGMNIKATWFHPNKPECWPMPLVIYLHANCGCRCDSLEILHLLGEGFSILTYDACGSGLSDGEYVTLGFYERQDIASVIEYVQGTKRASAIGLWGRSMGAVTSIMYASKDPTIRCLIADSPFSQLRRLIFDLVKRHAPLLPDIMTDLAVKKIRKKIAKLALFDIDDLDTVKYAQQCSVPAFVFFGEDDDFVLPYHGDIIAENYLGSCMYHVVQGGHNSLRRQDVHGIAVPFLKLYLIDKPEAERQRKAAAAATATTASSSSGGGMASAAGPQAQPATASGAAADSSAVAPRVPGSRAAATSAAPTSTATTPAPAPLSISAAPPVTAGATVEPSDSDEDGDLMVPAGADGAVVPAAVGPGRLDASLRRMDVSPNRSMMRAENEQEQQQAKDDADTNNSTATDATRSRNGPTATSAPDADATAGTISGGDDE